MFDWFSSDPETLWLNLTNAGLGVCVLVCVGIVAGAVVREVMAKARARVRNRKTFVYDAHSMMMPDLGLTMADGGEPLDDEKPKRSKKRS